MMDMERGDTPEFAVTAIVPSRLNVSPNGCGATSMVLPTGVRSLPLGITVIPLLLICV